MSDALLPSPFTEGITNNPITALAAQSGVALAAKSTDYSNDILYLPNHQEASDAEYKK